MELRVGRPVITTAARKEHLFAWPLVGSFLSHWSGCLLVFDQGHQRVWPVSKSS